MVCGDTLRIESYGERSVGPGCLFEQEPLGIIMRISEELSEILTGEEFFYDFSTMGFVLVAVLVGMSVSVGLISRRILFPRIMDLFSKTERIDGKTLFAPKSLGWMVGLLAMWQSVNWIVGNVDAPEGEFIWNTTIMSNIGEICRAGFVILMLIAAYRLVDYLDAFIVVEGDDMAARRSLASVAEAIGRLGGSSSWDLRFGGANWIKPQWLDCWPGHYGSRVGASSERLGCEHIRSYLNNHRSAFQCW